MLKFIICIVLSIVLPSHQNSPGGTVHWWVDGANYKFELRLFANADQSCDRTTNPTLSTGVTVPYKKNAVLASLASSSTVISSANILACVDYRADIDIYRADVMSFSIAKSDDTAFYISFYPGTYNLVAKVDPTRKYYNGVTMTEKNSSPKAGFLNQFTVFVNGSLTFKIAAIDREYDHVKCRIATSDEGNGTNTDYDGYLTQVQLGLNTDCSFTYEGETTAQTKIVHIMMEDYVSEDASTSMSSIPVVFIIKTIDCSGGGSCAVPVPFTSHPACESYTTTYTHTGLPSFHEFSPPNTIWNAGNVEITPSDTFHRVHFYCFASKSTQGATSDPKCLFLKESSLTHEISIARFEPGTGSVQAKIETVTLTFNGAISGLGNGGTISVLQTSDNGVVFTETFNSTTSTKCSNIGGNRLQCDISDVTLTPGTEYYALVGAPSTYTKYCAESSTISGGVWTFTMNTQIASSLVGTANLKVYTDSNYDTEVTSTHTTQLGHYIYLEINVDKVKDFVPYHCFATDTADLNDPVSHYLISQGCDEDNTVVRTVKTSTQMRFYFESFLFKSSTTPAIYLHCQVKNCASQCGVSCGSKRRRRSLDDGVDEDESLYHVSSVKIPLHPKSELIEDRRMKHIVRNQMKNNETIKKHKEEKTSEETKTNEDEEWKTLYKMVLIPYFSLAILAIVSYTGYRHFYD
ncbi:uncharacterized protein [Clytia hemisphaerica]